MVADVGNHLRTHQVVEELIRFLFIFRISRHREDVEERQRPLLRNEVGNIHAVFGLFRAVRRLPDIARPADGHADIPVSQVVDVLRGVEVANIRTQLQEQVGCRTGVVVGLAAVWIFAEIVKHGGENLFWRIEERDAAAFQLLEVFRLQHHVPAVQLDVRAQRRFDFIHVIANTGGRPQVRHRVFILRIVLRHQLQHVRIEVFPVR